MTRAVSKQQVTVEKVVFLELDAVRSQLGVAMTRRSRTSRCRAGLKT